MSDQLIRAISQDGLMKVSAVSTRDLTERARQIHKTLPVATAARSGPRPGGRLHDGQRPEGGGRQPHPAN